MFFEMRFDLGTLDSVERSLPFGLLVFALKFAGCLRKDLNTGPRASSSNRFLGTRQC